ncbi:hypothetical protein GBP346_B1339 [Burkholderia pseudomallei MSHR346]|nr:hypothetical protein GBP346_B1339 [Burkholderia pseudomallei MSHR346]
MRRAAAAVVRVDRPGSVARRTRRACAFAAWKRANGET